MTQIYMFAKYLNICLNRRQLRLKAGREGDNRRWDGSLTQWTWVWASSRRWWRTGKLGVLQSTGSQRIRHDWATEQQQQDTHVCSIVSNSFDPVDCSPLGSSVRGISQARILEWVAIFSSRGSIVLTQRLNPCQLCLLHWQVDSFTLESPGKPYVYTYPLFLDFLSI